MERQYRDMNYKLITQIFHDYDIPEEAVLGWHFIQSDKRLRYGDNREVVVGETLTVTGSPEVARWGLHAASSFKTAWRVRPDDSFFVCFVWVRGWVGNGLRPGLFCGLERNCIAMVPVDDIKHLLVEFQDREMDIHNAIHNGEITSAQHNFQLVQAEKQLDIDVLKFMGVIDNE